MIRLVFPLATKPVMNFAVVDHSLSGTPERKPDFRYLICWEPEIEIGLSGEKTIAFFTGDVTGNFAIKLTGITPEGQIICSQTNITFGEAAENDIEKGLFLK
jgi:hypothetical protein